MEQALYRKYRSRKFSEIIGQEHVTKTLANALKNGSVSHAYLFTGPRGVGKTSVARILAHEVNGLSYSADSTHLDIIEIDAASNRRIDEIRDLRDKVHVAPSSAKYKVYIIDEVHMLTREAFNALLKTLEEPPSHCIFILATTEAHKVPETITSRTQRFSFKPIPDSQATAQLAKIAKKEGIEIEPGALDMLARHGEGSFRDSLSMLDQIRSTGKVIDEGDVRSLLGLPSAGLIDELLQAISAGSSKKALDTLIRLRESGANAGQIAAQLSGRLRTALIEAGLAEEWQPALLKQLIEVPASSAPDEYLEVCVLEAAAARHPAPKPSSPYASEAAHVQSPKSVSESIPKKSVDKIEPPKSHPSRSDSNPSDFWPLAVELMKQRAASLYTALRLATPVINDDKLTLIFEYSLHQSKFKQAKNISTLQSVLEELTGQRFEVECVVDKQHHKALKTDQLKEPDSQPLQAINNIFGSLEVLES